MAAELLAIFGAIQALKVADLLGWIPEALKFLPLIGLSWVYFLIAMLALLLVLAEGDRLSTIGLRRPARIGATLLQGLATVVAVAAASAIADPIAIALFGDSGNISSFASLRGNLALLLYLLPFVWVIAAFGEEVLYRGYVMTRLQAVLGRSRTALAAILVLQAVAFGLAHLYQGPGGILSTGTIGLVYGWAVILTGGNLWVAIVAHGLIDTIGVVGLYTGELPA